MARFSNVLINIANASMESCGDAMPGLTSSACKQYSDLDVMRQPTARQCVSAYSTMLVASA
jgi:hypothetical protein